VCALLAASVDPNPWAQLGISGIVCALLFGAAWTFWRRSLVLEAEKNKLYEERIAREQFLSDRLAPLLADAVEILGSAPARFENALAQSKQATQAADLNRLVDKLEQTMRDIKPQ